MGKLLVVHIVDALVHAGREILLCKIHKVQTAHRDDHRDPLFQRSDQAVFRAVGESSAEIFRGDLMGRHIQNTVQQPLQGKPFHDSAADARGMEADGLDAEALQLLNGGAAAVVGDAHEGHAHNGALGLLQQRPSVLYHARDAGTGVGEDGLGHHVQPRKVGDGRKDDNIPGADHRLKGLLPAGKGGGNQLREADGQALHGGHGDGGVLHTTGRHHAVDPSLPVQRRKHETHGLRHLADQLALGQAAQLLPVHPRFGKDSLAGNIRALRLSKPYGHIDNERRDPVVPQALRHKRSLVIFGVAAGNDCNCLHTLLLLLPPLCGRTLTYFARPMTGVSFTRSSIVASWHSSRWFGLFARAFWYSMLFQDSTML